LTKILITGAAGVIGTILRRELGERYELRGLDRKRIAGVDSVAVDMAKGGRRVERAFAGCDAVIDLAGVAAVDTPWDVVRRNNIPATMNALEAARRHGVVRFVYASSNHVTGQYERDDPYARIVAGDYAALGPGGFRRITTADPIRPDGPYALGKALGEAAARYYADEHGLSAICLRIGTCRESSRPERPRDFATLLTHGDLARLVVAALEAPVDVRFGVFYGVSANTWRFWELADAREAIGYAPEDDAEQFR
jgi:nucleoside-diphosphate-sugar epimerase